MGALPDTVEKVLLWWDGAKLMKQEKVIWKSIPLAVLWYVWKLRNECKFRNSNPSLHEVIELIKFRVAIWAKTLPKLAQFSVMILSLTSIKLEFALVEIGRFDCC